MGLDPFNSRIIAIGMKDAETTTPTIFIGKDEPKLLKSFWDYAKDNILIGWNIDRFDVWFIKIRSLKHAIPTYRISTIDLMSALFPNGQKWKRLSDVMEGLFGAGKSKTGQLVLESFVRGDWIGIRQYLLSDLDITYKLYKRMEECKLI